MAISLKEKRRIDLGEAVTVLGVSSATVKNWIKHNYLTPEKMEEGKIFFDYEQVRDLQEKIRSGTIDRLNKRANKRHSTNIFIPEEYVENENVTHLIESIVEFKKNKVVDQKSILLAVALNLLASKGMVTIQENRIIPSNRAIKGELGWWQKNIEENFRLSRYQSLLTLNLSPVNDILGLTYQSLSTEGNKAQVGSYYTPKRIVDEIVNELIKEHFLILDPCCGTGQFLLSAAKRIKNPESIWGFDIDEIAVRIARLNLLLQFPEQDFSPNIYHKNTLLEVGTVDLFTQNNIPDFDAIITNPPWGVHFSQSETAHLKRLYPSIQSNEAFSYFLQKGIQLLKKGGTLSFILPESILNIKAHKDVRSIVLEKSKIKKIMYLDRVFKNVFTPVIRLDLVREEPTRTDTLKAEKAGQIYELKQSRLKKNHDFIFDVFLNEQDINIFEKIYSHQHTTLKNNADWALGIVTGNNEKFLSSYRTEENEPILTGKNIKRFVASNPKNFIKFDPEKFQQVAPEGKYRAKEKLIYKFISKHLVFSYDDQQILTLNSANIVIPKLNDYPIKSILAFFNSSLYQFLHQTKFSSIKVLRSDLEELPLPLIDQEKHNHIESLLKVLLSQEFSDTERTKKYLELDSYLMDIFDLNAIQKKYIKERINFSERLLMLK